MQTQRMSTRTKDNNPSYHRGQGSLDDTNYGGRIAGKYESDREDEHNRLFDSANRFNQIRRDLEAKDRINDSRQSTGSFSELVLEEYDKMNINPLDAGRNDQ